MQSKSTLRGNDDKQLKKPWSLFWVFLAIGLYAIVHLVTIILFK